MEKLKVITAATFEQRARSQVQHEMMDMGLGSTGLPPYSSVTHGKAEHHDLRVTS